MRPLHRLSSLQEAHERLKADHAKLSYEASISKQQISVSAEKILT
jgi:hypothetical protein